MNEAIRRPDDLDSRAVCILRLSMKTVDAVHIIHVAVDREHPITGDDVAAILFAAVTHWQEHHTVEEVVQAVMSALSTFEEDLQDPYYHDDDDDPVEYRSPESSAPPGHSEILRIWATRRRTRIVSAKPKLENARFWGGIMALAVHAAVKEHVGDKVTRAADLYRQTMMKIRDQSAIVSQHTIRGKEFPDA